MKAVVNHKLLPIGLAIALAAPLASHAESNFQTGAGALTATANVDFTITIPKVLYLQVGAGTLYANNATVNLITFTPTAATVGNGTAVAATAGSGDLSNGTVTAMVRGNGGNVTLGATAAAGGLVNAAGDTIPYSQIVTTVATLTSGTALPAPVLANGASAPLTLTATNKVVNQDARWTYTYSNTNVVAPGTYGGVNVLGGRVTYTASVL